MSSPRNPLTEQRPEIDLLLALSRLELQESEIAYCRNIIEEDRERYDWGLFIDQAGRHKVLPLIGRHFVRHRLHRSLDGVAIVPYKWLYGYVYLANSLRNEALAAEFGEIFLALNAAGLRYAVRKGPAIAEALYRDPGLRRMTDLDILVDRTDAPLAGEVLREHGYAQGRVSQDGGQVDPFRRSTHAFWRMHVNNELPYVKLSDDRAVSSYAVDICTDIFHKNAAGTVTTAEILERRAAASLCGVPSYALAPEDQFIDLCLHLRKEATARHYIENGTDLQLLKFLDVALMCEQVTERGGWEPLMRHVQATDTAESVYYALYFTGLLYPDAVPSAASEALRPVDCGFLEEYGAVDGNVGRWAEPFAQRLFSPERRLTVQGASSVPRA